MSTYTVDVHRDGYCAHRAGAGDGSPSAGRWLFRYPNLAINVYAGGMNVERIVPTAHAGALRLLRARHTITPARWGQTLW